MRAIKVRLEALKYLTIDLRFFKPFEPELNTSLLFVQLKGSYIYTVRNGLSKSVFSAKMLEVVEIF